MKRLYVPLIAVLVVVCADACVKAQEFKENINKEFVLQHEAARSALVIYNIFGSVHIEGYTGNKVILEVHKKITASDNTKLEKGKSELKIDFLQQNDSIVAYIAEPFDSRPDHNRDMHRNDREPDYSFLCDFVVRIPVEMIIDVSTVTDGDIHVANVTGNLEVHNVNGSVNLDRVKGITEAATVNGNVEIRYTSEPSGESSYQTINGDIKIIFPSDLSAEMQFKSMQGEFYTDFPDTELLPGTIQKNQEREGKGTLYKLEKTTRVRFGSGGKLFKFETLNGNVFIKKQS